MDDSLTAALNEINLYLYLHFDFISSHVHILLHITEGKGRKKQSVEPWCVREADENGEGMVMSQTCSSFV